MHAAKTYISVCGERHADLHVCVGSQGTRGRNKAGTAEMSLVALELQENQRKGGKKTWGDIQAGKITDPPYCRTIQLFKMFYTVTIQIQK